MAVIRSNKKTTKKKKKWQKKKNCMDDKTDMITYKKDLKHD